MCTEKKSVSETETWDTRRGTMTFIFHISHKMNDRAMMRETQANYRRRRQLVLRRPGPRQVPRLTCFWKWVGDLAELDLDKNKTKITIWPS